MRAEDLRTSLAGLYQAFGQTDSLLVGVLVNGGLAAIGVAVYIAASGVISMLGVVWAVLNGLGLLTVVLRE